MPLYERLEFRSTVHGRDEPDVVETHTWSDDYRGEERASVSLIVEQGHTLRDGTGRYSQPVTLSIHPHDAAELGRSLIAAARRAVLTAHGVPEA